MPSPRLQAPGYGVEGLSGLGLAPVGLSSRSQVVHSLANWTADRFMRLPCVGLLNLLCA